MKKYALGGKPLINLKLTWLLCLLVAWFASSPSMAQESNTDNTGGTSSLGLRYGFRAGMTVSGFYHYDLKQQKHTGSIPGVMAGGWISISPLPFADVSLEILYMQQGGTRTSIQVSEVNNTLIVGTANTYLHNLEVPLLAKFNIPGISNAFRTQIMAGPAVGFNLASRDSQEMTYQIGDAYATGSGVEDVRSEFQSMQYGVYGGAGVEIPLAAQTLSVDFRYRYGINPINNGMDSRSILSNGADIRSNSYIMTVGISF